MILFDDHTHSGTVNIVSICVTVMLKLQYFKENHSWVYILVHDDEYLRNLCKVYDCTQVKNFLDQQLC